MKTLITLLVLSLTLAAKAQYGFQTISRTSGGGGDSFYTWAGKENSNSWYFADFMAGLTNAIADLQTRAGFTNVNYLRLVQRTTTNETDIATLQTNAIFTNLLNAPFLLLSNLNISHSTNVTTLPVGTIFSGQTSNYLYRVVGNYTNASGTNFYRIAWDTNSW